MAIVARNGTAASPAPYARRRFTSPQDWREVEELRFWFRSSRGGDGSQGQPFYLAFEASSDPPATNVSWTRLLPVRRSDTWELHRFWIGDMPASLRAAVGILRLVSLDPTVAFNASIDDLIAVTPEPLQDVDAALLERLDKRFSINVSGNRNKVPALIDVPEHPGSRTLPYILITPVAVQPGSDRGGSGEIIDNYTIDGSFFRPTPLMLQIEYRIDVFAKQRSQKAALLEQILDDFGKRSFLEVSGELLELTPFVPSPESSARLIPVDRTPIFYRLNARMEIGARRFQRHAVPFLLVAPSDGRDAVELVKV
jgi:hypothetical protein